MNKLFEGFLNYRKNKLPKLAPLFRSLANGQNPTALVFACSDSRFDPQLVTSASPGDIFVHRSVGNLVPRVGADGLSKGDLSEASAIEYAVEVLKIRDIVVFGHSGCGAMNAVVNGIDIPEKVPNLIRLLRLAEPAHQRLTLLRFDPNLSKVDQLSQANVLVQMDNVRSFPAVRNNPITIHGAWFEIGTGEVLYFSEAARQFLSLDNVNSAENGAEHV